MTGRRVRLGLALSGGGARGLSHIGVLEALQEAEISIDFLAGTSMGGVFGAMHGAGIPLERMKKWAGEAARPRALQALSDLTLSSRGFLKGQRIYQHLAADLGADLQFSDLRTPLAVVAVDLRSGREVILRAGNVVDALRATISVPGVFLPVEREGMLLVDGGILNNLPVDVARDMGAEVVVAVNVLPDFTHNQPGQAPLVRRMQFKGIRAALSEQVHIQMIMISALTSRRLQEHPPEILISPVLPEDVGLLTGFHRAEEIIAAGKRAAQAAMPALRAVLDRRGL